VNDDVLMSLPEVKRISGGYDQPRRQLEALREQGFWRERLGRDHQVVLERAHYAAVCAGAVEPGYEPRDTHRPKLHAIRCARPR
jgi:transposase